MSHQSLAKLTSLSTQTLSLLLERQRGSFLSSYSTDSLNSGSSKNGNTLHLPQIIQNLRQLRTGILEMEQRDGRTEAVRLLRSQYDRMTSMLPDVEDVESLDPPAPKTSEPPSPSGSNPSLAALPPTPPSKAYDVDTVYTPYTDDPEANYGDPSIMLQTQRDMMNEQDAHLDRLSHSVNRQRDLSLQINGELDVHHGLLEELDTELGRTESRLGGARRRLDRVARGVKGNGSTVAIAVLILVLLILIIVFKT